MTRNELVKQKAHSLGQKYFPDANNVWARANFEAQWVSEACEEMAEWEHKRLVEKACEWLRNNIDFYVETNYDEDFRVDIEQLLKNIRKAIKD
jgi:hypothetical protein